MYACVHAHVYIMCVHERERESMTEKEHVRRNLFLSSHLSHDLFKPR